MYVSHSASVNLGHGRNVDADIFIHFFLACLNIQNFYVFYSYIIAVMFSLYILVILSIFCVYNDLLRCLMYMILICVYFTMCWVRDDLINELNQSITVTYSP